MAKFCPQCGRIILDRSIPACPECNARLPWAVPGQPAAAPEPAEPALPAEPARPADPDGPAGPPAQPPKPFRARPLQALPPGVAESPGPAGPVAPPPSLPPARTGPSPSRHPKKAVTEPGKGTGAARWIGICCGGIIMVVFIAAFFALFSEDLSGVPDADGGVPVSPTYGGYTTGTSLPTPVPAKTAWTPVPAKTVKKPLPAKTTRTPVPAPSEIAAAIGRTASDDTREATVYSATKMQSYTWTTGSSEYTFTEEAESGTTFLVIDAEVKNTGPDAMYASTGDFSLTDRAGTRYEPGLYYGDESFGYLKQLSNGQKNRGKILFEIPPDARDLKIFYDFGIGYRGGRVASWSVE